MPKLLSPDEIERYWRDGFLSPTRVMSEAAAADLRRRLEVHEAATGGPLAGAWRHRTHLLFTWLADLVRHPTILDAVGDLYGPDLLCWASSFFVKGRRDPAFVSWHQDSTYWGLDRPDVVIAWMALTPSTTANAAMRVIPGSHTLDQISHRDTFARHNLLTRGQMM
jgi:non-haem Fe2+, alpha-ketoglutarate-dependent halogenase